MTPENTSVCPSTGVQRDRVQVSLYADPSKRNCLGVQQPPYHSATFPSGFYSLNLWELLFPALEPCVGGLSGAGTLCFSREASVAKISLLIKSMSQVSVRPACNCALGPPTSANVLPSSLVVGLPSSLISVSIEWWLSCILVIIFLCLWELLRTYAAAILALCWDLI